MMNRRLKQQRQHHRGFTLLELLIVVGIIALLASAFGVMLNSMVTNAREAQTIATIRKVDGLITERLQGLDRAFDGRDFRKYVDQFQEKLIRGDPANGVPQLFGISRKAVEAGARKDFTRLVFPQRFLEMADVRNSTGAITPDANNDGVPDGDGIPDKIQLDEVYGPIVTWTGTLAGPSSLSPTNHRPETESAELLYFAVTRMEVFGVPLAPTDWRTQEVADTDNDGLPEFIDGWGNPLRFYRWPTRLFKPFGLLGADRQAGFAGVDDDGNGQVDTTNATVGGSAVTVPDPQEVGWPGSDDVVINNTPLLPIRFNAGLYIQGLPRSPIMFGTPPAPIPGDYDQLNEDPDDSFGVLLSEAKRLTATGIPLLIAVSESRYHTLDTFHKPLIVSAGPDAVLGLYEPNHNEDVNYNGLLDAGEDGNNNTYLDIGLLAEPLHEDFNLNGVLDPGEDLNGNDVLDSYLSPVAALDDITNRNRRAGD